MLLHTHTHNEANDVPLWVHLSLNGQEEGVILKLWRRSSTSRDSFHVFFFVCVYIYVWCLWMITGNTNIVMKPIKQQCPYRTNIRKHWEVLPLMCRRLTERMKSWEINTLEEDKIEVLKAFWYFFLNSLESSGRRYITAGSESNKSEIQCATLRNIKWWTEQTRCVTSRYVAVQSTSLQLVDAFSFFVVLCSWACTASPSCWHLMLCIIWKYTLLPVICLAAVSRLLPERYT